METKETKTIPNNQIYKNMIQNNWLAVVFANMDNVVEYVNPAACKLYGYTEEELIGQTTDIFNSQLSHNTDDIVTSIKERGYWFGEIIQRKKNDTTFDSLLSVQLILNEEGTPIGFASNSKDITIELESEKRLKKTIEEKDLLLKELHHRVKNNLALIKGIISLQDNTELDDNSKRIIDDFKNRIDAVATLHNTLYDPKNFNSLDLKTFVNDLCGGLNRSFSGRGVEISITNEMENYPVEISQAAPLCLIINEIVTNSFKHAFVNAKSGEIKIMLCSKKNLIKISDNGVGFDYAKTNKNSLGISLIKDLSDQIDAQFEFDNINGTSFSIILN